MTNPHRRLAASQVTLAGLLATGALGLASGADQHRSVNGTIWVANRGADSIRAFDADSGAVVRTVAMNPGSQPGDLAAAKGKIYVAEEQGPFPAIAILDLDSGAISRIFMPAGSRPHHVHASVGGNLVAVGLYGTDLVAVVDTRDDSLLGPWDSNPLTTNGRVHAAVFSKDGRTLYLANEGANEVIALDPGTGEIFWRMTVPGIHELAVTSDGKTAYASRRTMNRLSRIDLETQTFTDLLTIGLPDTLELSANEKLLTVGVRTSPAQLMIVDTDTLAYQLVNLDTTGQPGTIGGHQWTSPGGRYTFASFEGGTNAGVAVIDHDDDNRVEQRLPYLGRPHGVDHAPQ